MKIKILSAITTKRRADGTAYRRVTGINQKIITVYLHPSTETSCLREGSYVIIANPGKVSYTNTETVVNLNSESKVCHLVNLFL